jgi:hypothetical protein
VGDGLTESAFSSEHMGWGLLLQQKYVRKVRDAVNQKEMIFMLSSPPDCCSVAAAMRHSTDPKSLFHTPADLPSEPLLPATSSTHHASSCCFMLNQTGNTLCNTSRMTQ